ncbi:hypothetical protein ACWD25_61625, partial [Streptomyces sp. NPDC002920]
CLNGVRLGLDALSEGPDLRTPVADRLLVVTADGGECVSDATREADRIVASAAALAGSEPPPPLPRFTFAHRGSVQGFTGCPYHPGAEVHGTGDGLRVRLGGSASAEAVTRHVSTPTFLDPAETSGNFSTLASPTLYPGQTLTARLSATHEGTSVRPYVLYADAGGAATVLGEAHLLGPAPRMLRWQVPPLGGPVPFRVGFAFTTDAAVADIETGATLHELDWRGAPEHFEQSGVLLSSIWDTRPPALAPWVSSAKNFEADFAVTYSVSHPDALGVVTTGTREWTDYAVASRLTLSLHETAGLVARSRGHRRFYAGVFTGGDRLRLLHQHDGERHILAETPFPYERDRPYAVELRCRGRDLALSVDGRTRLTSTAADTLGGG